MSLVRGFDAAYPPDTAPPGCAVAAGYLGGNTPHPWTTAEWQRFQHLYQIGIWTGYQEWHPEQEAQKAAAAASGLGWIPRDGDTWRAVVLDMEGEADEGWVKAFGGQLAAEGYLCWPYLALSALSSDPGGYDVWLPDWTGVPAVPPYRNVIACQYAGNVAFGGTRVDYSVWDAGWLTHFGVGPRR